MGARAQRRSLGSADVCAHFALRWTMSGLLTVPSTSTMVLLDAQKRDRAMDEEDEEI